MHILIQLSVLLMRSTKGFFLITVKILYTFLQIQDLAFIKKKATQLILINHLNGKSLSRKAKTSTSLPVAIELIRLGKQKVLLTANTVEKTLSKKMRQA